MSTNPVNKDDPAYVGNEFFVQRKYEKALDAYSKSIEKYPDVAKLYSNRGLTYWKLNRPFDAFNDYEKGLVIEPNNEKLINRKCTALLEMRRFHEADQFLDVALKRMGRIPEKYEDEFKKLVDDMNRLKKEFVDGSYDLMAMVEESKKSAILGNHADYYAWDKFEILEVEGKGRGLVAKEKIELGQLLIACEAFVFVLIIGDESNTSNNMVDQIRKKLLNRPDLAEQFFRLYAGQRLGHLEKWTDGEPFDLERIDGIIRCNFHGDPDVLFEGTMTAGSRHVGISLVPSYINHTCVDFNCARYFVGDFTFVRATKAIEVGEELLFSYLLHGLAFDARQSNFEHNGFECHCRLCEMERHDSIDVKQRLAEMRQVLYHLQAVSPFDARTNDDIQLFKRFVEELRGYRPGLSLDYLSVSVRRALAVWLFFSDPMESVVMWKELIEDLKSAGDFFEARCSVKALKFAAIRSGNQDEQDECDELAREIAKMFFDDERVADLEE